MNQATNIEIFIKELIAQLSTSKADVLVVNVESDDKEILDTLRETLTEQNIIVTNSLTETSLSSIYDVNREEVLAGEYMTALVVNASYHLGWTQVLSVKLDVHGSKEQTAGQAVLSGSGNVFNGEPYQDEEIL